MMALHLRFFCEPIFFLSQWLFDVLIYFQHFLSKLPVPVSVEPDKLTRWHPEFNVDMLPHISPSSLPEPPKSMLMSTAQDVLDVARNKLPDRV